MQDATSPSTRRLTDVRVLMVSFVVVGSSAMMRFDHARSWHYFSDAAALLVAGGPDGGLHMYRSHPEFQFGPLATVLSVPFTWLPPSVGRWAVALVGSLIGVVVWTCLRAVQQTRRASPMANDLKFTLAVGLPFLALWLRLAAYTAHLDDVITLAALVASGVAIERRRPAWIVGTLIIAVAMKPWAIVFLPIALLGARSLAWWRPPIVAAVAAASWLPFVIADSGTVASLQEFAIKVDSNSGVRALGIADPATPMWLRSAQMALGLAVVTWVVVVHRAWPAALVAGICARLLLDPATHHYYNVGFVLLVGMWEMDRRPGRLPLGTASGAVLLELAASDVTLGGFMAAVRFAMLASVTLIACAAREREARWDRFAAMNGAPTPQ